MREGLLLELDGGWGEIAPLPNFRRETLEECEAELKRNWSNIRTYESTTPAIKWGLHCAKQPWPPKPFKIPLSALLWDSTVPPGYKTVKLKLKNLTIESAIKKVKEIQGSFEIRLDCNRAWSLEEAIEFTQSFRPNDFAYLEEPTRNLKEFSLRTHFPLAIDESLREGSFLDIPTLKAAIIKPMILGAVPDLGASIDLVVSGVYESGVGTLHNATIPSKRAYGLDTYRYLASDVLKTPLQIEEGCLVWNGIFKMDYSKLIIII